MIQRKYFSIGICLCVVNLLFIGCSPVHRFPVIHPVPKETPELIARARAENYFIKARDYERHNLHQMAEHFYELAYDLDSSSEILKNLLIEKYVVAQKYEKALSLVKAERTIDELSDTEKRIVSSLYINMKEYLRAIEILETVSQVTVEEHATLGYLYERLNKIPQSIVHYEIIFRSDPKLVNVGLKLGTLYLKESKLDKAESLYVLLENRVDDKSVVLNALAHIRLLKNDTVSAENYLQTVLLLDETNENALRMIAQIYISRGEYGKAISCYERMPEKDYLTDFYNKRSLALLYYYNGDDTQAAALFKTLLADHYDDYELHFYLGLVFASQKKFDLAEIQLQKTLALKDNYSDAWRHLCYIQLKQKNWEKAEEYAEQFKNKAPESADAWRLYGYVLNVRKRFKPAIAALIKAVSFDQTDAGTWFELGSAYERSGEYSSAADAFRRVLNLRPNDAAAANYLGYMWADLDTNLDSAKTLIEIALQKEPDNGAYLDSYAWVLYRLGKIDSAQVYIIKAMEQLGNDPVIWDHLGDIRAKRGDIDGAREAYQKSVELGTDPQQMDKIKDKIRQLMHKDGPPVLEDALLKKESSEQ